MCLPLKGFKVTDAERHLRVGIAARCLADLRSKTAHKFHLKPADGDSIIFQTASDGTLIDSDDYLTTLRPQTLLVWVREGGEEAATDGELLYRVMREVNEEYLTAGEKVQEFFGSSQEPGAIQMRDKVYKLATVLRSIEDGDRARLSGIEEDPHWFEGIDSRAQTKEDYMFRRAQDRIRSYYYKTRIELTRHLSSSSSSRSSDKHCLQQRRQLDELLKQLKSRLSHVNYYGCYFDRRCCCQTTGSSELRSLCDNTGRFQCGGAYNRQHCDSRHEINPYVSRELRIVFQTWNLDHVIERTRSVIPVLVATLATCLENGENGANGDGDGDGAGAGKCPLDVAAVFRDLFTTSNLKFVHVVCHDKSGHVGHTAGPYLL